MKLIKLLAVLVSILLSTFSMQGQKMIWTALNGGENSNGAVVAYDLTYNQSQALASLDGNPLGTYEITLDLNLFNSTIFNSNGLIYGADGKLYGTTSSMNMNSSLDAYGGIYSIDPISGDLEVLFSFVGNHTNRPIRNSKIYDCYNRDL